MIQAVWKVASTFFLLLLPVPTRQQASPSPTNITTASVADIQLAAGFVRICGRDSAISEENLAVLKASKDDPLNLLSKAMGAAVTDRQTCIAYLSGVIDGWREGHEHGVAAMEFPNGIPDIEHYKQALSSLSVDQLRTAKAGMDADPLCLPEDITAGETLHAIVRYIRAQISKNSLMGMMPTVRIVHPAFKATFRCPNEKLAANPDGI